MSRVSEPVSVAAEIREIEARTPDMIAAANIKSQVGGSGWPTTSTRSR